MKVGKEQLEESANIVEEVTFELRSKDEEIQKINKTLNIIAKLFRPDREGKETPSTQRDDMSIEGLVAFI